MNWLPIARDFREDLRAALARPKPNDGLEDLAALASHRLSFVETVQLDRALTRLEVRESPGFQPVRLAILASSTVDHLPPAIRVAGLRRKLLIDVHSGTYGQYRQDLLDPTSALRRFQPQAALFSLTAREVIAGIALNASAAEVDGAIGRFVERPRGGDAWGHGTVRRMFEHAGERKPKSRFGRRPTPRDRTGDALMSIVS